MFDLCVKIPSELRKLYTNVYIRDRTRAYTRRVPVELCHRRVTADCCHGERSPALSARLTHERGCGKTPQVCSRHNRADVSSTSAHDDELTRGLRDSQR
jgi:hypothetical protein